MMRARFLVAILFVAVLSAVACSPGTEAGSEDGKIRIGLALSLSGALADSGEPILQGAEMWVEEGNKILGKEVELVVKDDESLPETDAKLYEYLISVENVDLLLGPYGSGNSAAVTPITDRHNRFILMTGASAAEIFGRSKTSVQLYTPQLHMPELPLRVASKNGYETIAAAGVDNDYGTEILRGIELYADEFGMDVVHKELYEETTQDLSSTILKMKQADPDVVYVGAYIPDSILFMRQAKEQGLEPKMFVLGPTGPVTQQFVDALGSNAEYVFGTAQWHPNAAYPGAKNFVESFKKENGEVPNYLHATGYGALEVLQ
ncbi:MAG: amino acid ABC transporter substrate-binding protein, partial [Actinomycetota bacterium]